MASKLFRNSTISEANWKKIEDAIKKIMNDCMGGKLYNALDSALGSGTLAIKFENNPLIGGKFSLTEGITITGYDSQDLFHEVFHGYQSYQETQTSFKNSSANRELEAYLAEYMYSGNLDGGNSFDPEVEWLFDEYLTKNGTLKDPSMEAVFNDTFKNIANHIKIKYEGGRNLPPNHPDATPYDSKRTGMQSIANIRNLAKDC